MSKSSLIESLLYFNAPWDIVEAIVHTDSENNHYCVFHAPMGQKRTNKADFQRKIFNWIDTHRGGLNFGGAIFEWDIYFVQHDRDKSLDTIDFTGAIFHGKADFKGITFRGNAEFRNSVFEQGAGLSETKFKEKADFAEVAFGGDANFMKATFTGEAIFNDVIFCGAAMFSGATFSDKGADFREATFSDKGAYFVSAKFNGKAVFYKATFSGLAYFRDATFSGEGVFFSKATFSGKADFGLAKFSGVADFREVQVINTGKITFAQTTFTALSDFKNSQVTGNGVLEFQQATFAAIADFRESNIMNAFFINVDFKGRALFNSATFEACSFHEVFFFEHALFFKTHFNIAGFSNTIFMDSAYFSTRGNNGIFGGKLTMHSCDFQKPLRMEGANLKQASFLNTDLRDIRFVDCDWPQYTNSFWEKFPRIKAWAEHYIPPKIYDEGKAEPAKVEALYRQMKQRCKADHNESEASEWHYNEKEAKRRQRAFKGFNPLSLLFWYGLTSGYAERPIRAGLVLLALIALFALPLMFGHDRGFGESVLSIIQYATLDKNPEISLSKDDCVHVGWRYYKLIVQLAIYLQVTFFALAIRNRYRR